MIETDALWLNNVLKNLSSSSRKTVICDYVSYLLRNKALGPDVYKSHQKRLIEIKVSLKIFTHIPHPHLLVLTSAHFLMII
jgi:hypothetical protein